MAKNERITISRCSSNEPEDDWIKVEITGLDKIIIVTMSSEDFAECLIGLGRCPCDLIIYERGER